MTDQVTEIMQTWGVDRATAERQVAHERETERRDRLKISVIDRTTPWQSWKTTDGSDRRAGARPPPAHVRRRARRVRVRRGDPLEGEPRGARLAPHRRRV